MAHHVYIIGPLALAILKNLVFDTSNNYFIKSVFRYHLFVEN